MERVVNLEGPGSVKLFPQTFCDGLFHMAVSKLNPFIISNNQGSKIQKIQYVKYTLEFDSTLADK